MKRIVVTILMLLWVSGCTAILETYTELPGDGPTTDAADAGDSGLENASGQD